MRLIFALNKYKYNNLEKVFNFVTATLTKFECSALTFNKVRTTNPSANTTMRAQFSPRL